MDKPVPDASWQIDLTRVPKFRLGAMSVDPTAREVSVGRDCERLQPQSMKVLVALAQGQGEVVTREFLMERCWGGRFVSDDVINRAILLLRGLAGRSGGSFTIETVPKSGYRLREVVMASGEPIRLPIALAVILAAVAVGLSAYLPRMVDGDPPVPIVALVPFSNEGNPPTAMLADAIGNSLIHMLSDSGLPIRRSTDAATARSSADFLLTGNVRRSGSAAIVVMQLEDARQRTVLFSKTFDAPLQSSGSLPDRLGAYAAANLSWSGTLRILDRRQPIDPRLRTELLKQLFLTVEGRDLLRAYEISAQIARRAPDSTMAQLAVAHNTGMVLGMLPREQRADALRRARSAEQRARLLSPEFGDTYTPACLLYPYSWAARCEDALREGLRVDPEAPYASAYLRRKLSEVGRYREALQFARMSLANDPYKPGKLGGLIGRLEALGQQEESAQVFESATRWWPDNAVLYEERVDGAAQRGDFDGIARFAYQSPENLFPVDRAKVERLAAAVREERADHVRAQCASATAGDALAKLCLVALTQVADIDSAFRVASVLFPAIVAATPEEEERLWLNNPARLPTAYLAAPALAPMRRDARFLPLARSVGLLRYWRSGRLPDFCRSDPEPVCTKLR